MLIEVTQDDIDKGIRCNCSGCPLALAIGRALNATMLLGSQTWRRGYDDEKQPLPRIASKFIMAFDNWRPVAPFSFDLDISRLRGYNDTY